MIDTLPNRAFGHGRPAGAGASLIAVRRVVFAFSLCLLFGGCQSESQKEVAKGEKLLEHHAPDAAIDCFNRARSHDHESSTPPFLLGVAYLEKEDPQSAIRHFSDAIGMESENAHYRLGRAMAYLANQEYDQAQSDLNAVKVDAEEDNEEYVALVGRMKMLASRGANGQPLTVSSMTPPTPKKSSWRFTAAHGLLGESEIYANNPVGCISVYVLVYVFVFLAMEGLYIEKMIAPLSDEEKGGNIFLCLCFAVVIFFLFWGFSHWLAWLLSTIGTVFLGACAGEGAK